MAAASVSAGLCRGAAAPSEVLLPSTTPFSSGPVPPLSLRGLQSSGWETAGGCGRLVCLLPPRPARLFRRRRGFGGTGAALSADDTLSAVHTEQVNRRSQDATRIADRIAAQQTIWSLAIVAK